LRAGGGEKASSFIPDGQKKGMKKNLRWVKVRRQIITVSRGERREDSSLIFGDRQQGSKGTSCKRIPQIKASAGKLLSLCFFGGYLLNGWVRR